MKKVIKIVVVTIMAVVVLLVVAGLIIHKPLPQGTQGPKAEALTDSLLKAINYEGYNTLDQISWLYPKGHHFVWNKQDNEVNVKWDDYEVTFKPDSMTGTAYKKGEKLSGKKEVKAIQKAWELFANDSFWLLAPFKVRDPGTERSIVKTDKGDALLVTYTSGGVTPGDSYLWILDENYRPTAWQLWVKIIPPGGLEFSWEGWQKHEGVWFALDHKGPGPVQITLTNLKVTKYEGIR